MTGVYDPELQLVYWTTGNPSPDYNGDDRLGDNLYASSVVALEARTGRLKWYFQFTPHNVWDWDAQQPTVLIDTSWEGRPRKLLVQASRNGFFYVIDRTDGKFLLGKAVRERPDVGERDRRGRTPRAGSGTGADAGRHASLSFGARRRKLVLHVLQSADRALLRADARELQRLHQGRQRVGCGKILLGGSTRQDQEAPNQKVLRAIDVKTGNVAWELPQAGPGAARGGTLVTATGLLFFCDDQDRFVAVDASTGKTLWQFGTNSVWRASPMTYEFDGQQHMAIASGSNIIAFGLVK